MTTDTTLSESLVVTEIGDLQENGKSVFMDTFKPIEYKSNRFWKLLLLLVWLFTLTYNLLY